MLRRLIRFTPVLASVCLLGTLGAYNLATRVSSRDAEPYHARVFAAAALIPSHIGAWNGVDEPVLREAIQLLKPNVMFDRRYTRAGGESASLLLVQCRDSRDMLGHYPPICYPAHGYVLESQASTTLHCQGLDIPAEDYEFSFNSGGGTQRMAVLNFMVLPDGRILRDMEALRHAAGYRRAQAFGAAQVQLVFNAEIPPAQREEVFSELSVGIAPVLQAIRSGDLK